MMIGLFFFWPLVFAYYLNTTKAGFSRTERVVLNAFLMVGACVLGMAVWFTVAEHIWLRTIALIPHPGYATTCVVLYLILTAFAVVGAFLLVLTSYADRYEID